MTAQGYAPARTASRGYLVYLIVIALLGWSLASYDSNLLTLTMPDIAKTFHLSSATLGALGFIIFAAEFVVALFVGWGMDRKGRRWMWMLCLALAAVFTGLTFFVQAFWQLALVRALASGFANAELGVSITLVNEQVPGRQRGFLYSIVQGGWPIGVFMASGIYLLVGSHGWRPVYLFGVIPLVLVAIGRFKIRESDRFLHVKKLRKAIARGDEAEAARLREERPVNVEELKQGSVREIFARPGPVRSALSRLSIAWLLYSTAYVATNSYISYWLVNAKGWTAGQAAELLLACGGIGFFFYLLGGALGEKFGRRNVLIASGVLVGPLNLVVLLVMNQAWVAIIFFVIYQATNGTWSGAGYSYQAECFPTRVRGTAIGWMAAMFVGGLAIGSLLWTVLSATTSLTITWLVIAVGVGAAQGISTFFLPGIKPGQELEEIIT
ncbi:MAG: MFS transporter [Nocardiopsaceae bacterium]|nr:MFS transporter [Nocardiopsaceae bacterium]